MEVTVKLEEEALKAMQRIAAALDTLQKNETAPQPQEKPAPKKAKKPDEETPPTEEEEEADSTQETPEPLTLVAVRAKLGAISQGGKQDEVRALIEKYGASKLTDVPPEMYADLVAEAEALG